MGRFRTLHRRWLARYWAPWCVLVVGLLLAGFATAYVARTTHHIDQMRFERWVHDTSDDVQRRLQTYITLLEGAAGLFSVERDVTRAEFHAYVERLDLTERYRGVQGVGFTLRVAKERIPEIEALMQAERGEAFQHWPESEQDEFHTIIFLEPEDARNRAAIGFDMYSQPVRRAAMQRARDTGRAAASGRVTLVQEITPEKQPGFLIYVPVYEGGRVPATVEARREELVGFAYSPFRAGDLLHQVLDPPAGSYLNVAVYDGPMVAPESLLYQTTPDTDAAPRFRAVRTLEVAGQPWTMVFSSHPAFERMLFSGGIVGGTLVGGLLISLVLFGITLAQSAAYREVEETAAEQYRSEQALRESEERLRMALDASNQFAFTWEIDSDRLTHVGDSARILGRTPATSEEMHELVHPEDRIRVEATVAAAGAGELVGEGEMEFRIVRPDGEVRWLHERAVVTRDPEGRPVHVVGIAADVTRQKEIEREMRSLNETLEQRVAARTLEAEQRSAQLRALASELTAAEQRERRRLAQVLHDHLQQLLVAANLRIGFMERKLEDPEARDGVNRVRDLLQQAIDASRSLTVELSPPVLYDAGLGRGLEWLARTMEEKYGLTVAVSYEDEAQPRNEDTRAFLFQSVRELLFNTVKHAKAREARVHLRRLDAGHIRIVVEDDGAGFDPAVLQVQGAKAEHFGIFSIQQRIEMLGGGMEIQSAPGEGTRITLTAPVHPEPAAITSAPSDTNESDEFLAAEKLLESYTSRDDAVTRVLLADDHELLREGIGTVLAAQPDIVVVGEASDGEEAVTLARQLQPDVVVMDVTMPRMDGVEATRRILAERPDTRVIGLSMHEGRDLAAAMMEAGATAYLNKTGPTDELLGLIRRQ